MGVYFDLSLSLISQAPGVMWLGLTLLSLKSLTLVGRWPSQEGLMGADVFLHCFCLISCFVEPLLDPLGFLFLLP